MADPARIFVVAGEPSGDQIGADLLRRLRIRRAVLLRGIGGPGLEGEGLKTLFPMSDLSVMGFADVLPRLPQLYFRLRQTVAAVLREKPDLLVLIDSQVFSERVARALRKNGYRGKILLYVAPSVWAWKPERAPALKTLYDEVLAVLPFEPAVMKKLGGPTTSYVGHPALAHTTLRQRQPTRGPLLLLPGSRAGELTRHLPLMRAVTTALGTHASVTGLVLPTVRSQEARVVAEIGGWGTPVYVTADVEEKRKAFSEAVAAVAVTGTVTLELALSGVPMVTTYVADRTQMARAEKYRVRFASLPNILLGDRLVPEVAGPRRQPIELVAEIGRLLDDPGAIEAQRAGFERIRRGMERGAPDAPLVDAADRVEAYLRLVTGT